MTDQMTPNIVVTPATWRERVKQLKKTSIGLLNVVGWYGSTHQQAMWRKAPEFLDVFREEQVIGFDPQIDDWTPSFIEIEAEVLAKAAVLIIRLENNELLNGSLGSIAEIGMALASAALRGQIVIVSIEDTILTSLAESGAIAQYEDLANEKLIRQALQQAGVPDRNLAVATQEEVFQAFQLVQAMAHSERPSFRQVEKSLLGETQTFQNADNIRRVRALVQGHLERLHGDERFLDFFYYSKQIA